MTDTNWDVFIAHAGPDLAAAEQLFGVLEGSCRVFLASKSIGLGETWDDKLAEAQQSARFSIVLISSSTPKAYYQREEIAQAIALARKEADRYRVVPVYLDGPPDEVSDVPYGLRLRHGMALTDDVTLRTVADRLLVELASTVSGPSSTSEEPSGIIWNVPFRRNQFFVGRSDLLADLAVRSTETTAVTAVNGMGGVGKTELAIEYAYQRRSALELVWWVRAESPPLLIADLAQLAEHVGVHPDPESQEQTAISVIQWLGSTSQSWLLILDNAAGPEPVAPWIPESPNGQTVITSRHPTWGETAMPLPVDVFSSEVAVGYLLRRTSRDDREGAARLAKGLGYMALALNQAGGYLNKVKRLSFEEYLARLESDGLFEIPADGSRADHTVATLWAESFDKLRNETPVAAELLQMTALCGPEAIPLELFERPTGDDDDLAGWEPSVIDHAVAELSGYGLAEQGLDAVITVHRLVQLAARADLDLATRFDRLKLLYELLSQRFPQQPEDPSTWAECARYAPHVDQATSDVALGPILSELT